MENSLISSFSDKGKGDKLGVKSRSITLTTHGKCFIDDNSILQLLLCVFLLFENNPLRDIYRRQVKFLSANDLNNFRIIKRNNTNRVAMQKS